MNEAVFSFSPKDWSKIIAEQNASSAIIIGDHNTHEHCWPQLLRHCPELEAAACIWMEPGEATKTLDAATEIWDQLLSLGADRNTLLIALGGGVISDLTGFVATTYKRGVSFIYVPTTNLAMCDAAIGGKTGVNFSGFKNQIGTICWPAAILYDREMLNTLPDPILRSGFAETIKHALIADAALWAKIKRVSPEKLWKDWEVMERSIQIKRDIVAKDLRENDLRQALNFGHTAGHGIEGLAESIGEPVAHGDAVAIGMLAEAWLSQKIGKLPQKSVDEIAAYVRSHYSSEVISELDPEACMPFIMQDKKNRNGNIICALLRTIGVPVVDQKIKPQQMLDALHWAMKTIQ